MDYTLLTKKIPSASDCVVYANKPLADIDSFEILPPGTRAENGEAVEWRVTTPDVEGWTQKI